MRLRSESAVAHTTPAGGYRLPGLVLAAASAVLLTACWPAVWLVLPIDGLYVIALLLTAAGWGAWPAVWLGPRGQSAGRQVCLATALGLGVLSTAALVLGVAGMLSRPLVCALLIAGAVLGATRLARAGRSLGAAPDGRGIRRSELFAKALVLLPLCIPIAIVLYGACLPPGLLWTGEARGYDVLEYHLQVPREYYDAGRIQFLPNNVYASFPQGTELLYLLLMYLAGGPLAAAIPAQLLHAALGGLTVAALLVWTPRGWPRTLVALVAGTSVWLAYLGALAYVELGMLFFAAVAVGLLISENGAPRGALAAGICAGLSAGCKYTAVALVAIALGAAWLITMRGGLKARAWRLGMYSLGAALAFSPWLIRNAAFTGNPVYPFAYNWFGGRDWSPAQAGQWQRGHALPADSAGIGARTRTAFEELFNSGMYNHALWLLGLGGLALLAGRRQRGNEATTQGSEAPRQRGNETIPARQGNEATGQRGAEGSEPEAPARANASTPESRCAGTAGVPLLEAGASSSASSQCESPAVAGTRPAVLLAIWAALIVLAWAAFTRMPGRFAMPVIVPLALLLGRGAQRAIGTARPRPALAAYIGFALAGALLGDVKLVGLLRDEATRWQHLTSVPLREMVDRTEAMRDTNPINTTVPPGAYVWMVGDARAFYVARRCHYSVDFNRDPWLEFSAHCDPPASIAWLRTHGVTHVVFSWAEIERLRRSYGFPPLVTPAWVDSLAKCGLKLISGERGQKGAVFEVYEVVPE